MAKVYEVHLSGNCTELNGTIIRIPVDAGLPGSTGNSTVMEDEYDHKGAMQFIVATVLVYSICGVLCTLVNRMKRLRGKSHRAYQQDEHVQRYLKSEKYFKYDGRKAKMLYECGQVVKTVTKFEEKQRLREIEKEIVSGDFVRARDENLSKKKKKKKKRNRRRSVEGTLGHIGLSLFYIPENKRSTYREDTTELTSADETVILMTNNNGADTQTEKDYLETHINLPKEEDKSDSVNALRTKGKSLEARSNFPAKGDNVYANAERDMTTNNVHDMTVHIPIAGTDNSQYLKANSDSLPLPETILDIERLEIAYADD